MNLKGADVNNYIRNLIKVLPHKPGVYQFIDRDGEFLYVGKAQDLKKRVSSYFSKAHRDRFKIHVLVDKIADIRHIVVDSESDALLLENNLIKKHQPRYNVLLKDDKTFPWICVKNEPFPRVFSTRNYVRDGSVYYGPYTSGFMVKTILEMVRSLFPLRNCKLNLTGENISKGKFKVCLEYHMGNCKGPCVGFQGAEEYASSIEQVHHILKGNITKVATFMKERMDEYAADYKYEEAQSIKEKIKVIERYRSKSTIVNPRINNVDVFSIIQDESAAYVNYLKVKNGAVVQAHTVEMKPRLAETREDLLLHSIVDIREKVQSNAKEIIVPLKPSFVPEGVRYVVPQRGDKKHLLELSERNARYYRKERRHQQEVAKKGQREDRILEAVRKDFHLKEKPVRIECFDNSNLQGGDPVAACVVFQHARPLKSEYRHYHVKNVEKPDDYASMAEIVRRRYSRLLREKQPLPQLIVVDGGKGQLNAAVKSLEQIELRGKIAVVGIAKRLEEIYFPGDKVPLYIDKNSETLRLIQQLRNEAHRFGIQFHRKIRNKRMTSSSLDQIKGIGERTKEKLLKQFGSVEGIRQAGPEKLSEVIGTAKTRLLEDHFRRSTM